MWWADFLKFLGEVWIYIQNSLVELSVYAKSFNVDPIVFIVIYFGTTPFILIPVALLGRIAIKKTDRKYFLPLIAILILAILAPYLYIIVFGHGINIFIKLIIIVIAILSLLSLLNKKLNFKIIPYLKSKIEKKKD